ncbi:hypothetical protein SDRG_08841 [Saprolegnia diclina VS20]|uniref:CCT domain-containing protein n=1 Tax=Saprolegnia diclina (strain VS20) TaxID=1156394 RepID=T0Q787_SAPDV|nr:hypothetical protein SDRG_08841 [Saprolegnia diclina VS20]EQC33739.1 hypothetical protein SDRG_08841 [Saprolegnia diclina VS20]|eukprot:XP_008612962.1 hypothetical protein SDRG_08841 [Saprolegnia diclina VS20]
MDFSIPPSPSMAPRHAAAWTDADLEWLEEGFAAFFPDEAPSSRPATDARLPMVRRPILLDGRCYSFSSPSSPVTKPPPVRTRAFSLRRQEASAKRRRIKGRYAGFEKPFLPITALQGPLLDHDAARPCP